jgi:pimeloyl-ACP methyl ester carboxylesterase
VAPTAVAPTATAAPGQAVTFAAEDGTTLNGRWYGDGSTAVVLANMSDNDPAAWDAYAPELAGSGVSVLTFSYRYAGGRGFSSDDADNAVRDLEAAVAYTLSRGAERLVLVGASLGGMAVAKLADPVGADAVIILGAPNRRSEFALRVTDAEMAAITAPKLFIVSEDDPNVPPEQTRPLYDAAKAPRRWVSFPSTAHGTQLLASPHGDQVRRLIAEACAAAGRG